VSWISQKQKVVALSSCEAEYIAAAYVACQGVWLARLVNELLDQERIRVKIKVDNQSAIALCKNPVYHERSKHIDVKYHFVRSCVEDGKVEVEHVRTDEQHADILTKPLPRLWFLELKKKIGMQLVSSGHQA
jgi:hypothetical protein